MDQMYEAFEQWHNEFYGPQDEYRQCRSLERYPPETGLGYCDSTVQAQFALFCDLQSSLSAAEKERDEAKRMLSEEAESNAHIRSTWMTPEEAEELRRERDEAKALLNSELGCESCAGQPSLMRPEVSAAAFDAVFRTELLDQIAAMRRERDEAIAWGEKLRDFIVEEREAWEDLRTNAIAQSDPWLTGFADQRMLAFDKALSTPAPAALAHLRQEIRREALKEAENVCIEAGERLNGLVCAAAIHLLAEQEKQG